MAKPVCLFRTYCNNFCAQQGQKQKKDKVYIIERTDLWARHISTRLELQNFALCSPVNHKYIHSSLIVWQSSN